MLPFLFQEVQSRIDEAEQSALKGGLRAVAKLEQTLKKIEGELETESRRHADAAKNAGKAERRSREITFELDEERKNYNKLVDLVEKLQGKIKLQRRQIDEAVSEKKKIFTPKNIFL